MARRSSQSKGTDDAADPKMGEDRLDELRELILGPDRNRFTSLAERLRDREVRTKEVSEVLAEAVAMREAQNKDLSRALAPAVEDVIHDSVRRDPAPLVDALFPVMGPAIRKAISDALRRMVESLNKGLEYSLSPKGLRWRLEAWRTGRPFGEIVLTHTLKFRVEQVFLIEKSSGLLIEHVARKADEAEDPSLVSGMLTAIRDFVQDSFQVDEAEGVAQLQVGNLAVWVEAGPTAVLAAVIRGNAPGELRGILQNTIEEVYRKYGGALNQLEGESGSLPGARVLLERCLLEQGVQERRKPVLGWIALAVVLLLLIAVLGTLAWRSLSENRRMAQLVERLNEQPGLLVTAAKREEGHYRITGFRDPLASSPESIAEQLGVKPDEMTGEWELYHSLDPPIVLNRIRQWIAPPPTVDLRLQDGILFLRGTADRDWIERVSQMEPVLFGLRGIDVEGLKSAGRVRLETLKLELEKRRVRFSPGSSQPAPTEEKSLEADAARIKSLAEEASRLGVTVNVEIRGHTDETGPESFNRRLSRRRAEFVRDVLLRLGVASDVISVVGMGTTAGAETLRQEERRSVTFVVTMAD